MGCEFATKFSEIVFRIFHCEFVPDHSNKITTRSNGKKRDLILDLFLECLFSNVLRFGFLMLILIVLLA
jgi:hypothetical protein